jgi:hypothetical protein
LVLAAASLAATAWPATPGPIDRLFAPCRGDCALATYAGHYVDDTLTDVILAARPPTGWTYEDDLFVGTALSRELGRFGCCWHLEPEAGLGQRFGAQDETEVWAALYLRYRGFPWDHVLVTSFAISTGLNYATGISELEKERSRDDQGSRLMHFFSPEVTFALPRRPEVELLFRLHHRSGVFGLVSDAWGGAQYGTVGVRVRF